MTKPKSGDVLSAIRDPRALLEGLFEHSPVAYQVYRADGHCLLVNPAFRRLFGSEPPPEYCLFDDTILEERGITALVRRAFTGETIQLPPIWYDPRELRQLEVHEGKRVGIATTMFPLRDETGNVAHVALCFEEVSAQLQRQQERDHVRVVLDAALDCIVVMDAAGRIVEFNPAAEATFGHARADVIGKPLADVIVPEASRAHHRAGLARYLASGAGRIVGRRIELEALRADGTCFPAEVAIVESVVDGARMFTGYIRDITERERAATALRDSEHRLRLAQQVAQIGTFEWNLETGVNVWTRELEAMYGLAPGEFGNTQPSWEALLHPDDRAAALVAVARALESGDTMEGEWRVVWPDGTVHWLVGRFQAVRDDAGRATRLVGVNVDITSRKLAETAVRSLNENLERRVQERTAELAIANRELEAFSYSVAHDLRGPLRGVSGFAEILLDDYRDRLDPEGREHLLRICDAAVMMGDRIDALLALARLARAELHPAPTDMSAIARSIAGGLAEAEPERKVRVDVQNDLRLVVDPRLARVLLENLIGNAWKFTRRADEPRIEIGDADREGEHVVFVRDNGAGFDMSYASKLFLPFQRLHAARDYPGTGVGLATVRRIADRHGGRVWAEGRVGGGATFYFSLPAVR